MKNKNKRFSDQGIKTCKFLIALMVWGASSCIVWPLYVIFIIPTESLTPLWLIGGAAAWFIIIFFLVSLLFWFLQRKKLI